MNKLLNELSLGDKRPTQFLREIRNLSGELVSDQILKNIFLRYMPPLVQQILSITGESMSLADLATAADKVLEIPTVTIAAVNQIPASENSKVTELEKTVQELRTAISELKTHSSRSRSHSDSHSRNRSQSPRKQYPRCWYHYKFGAKARRCEKPCDWVEQPSGNEQARH